MASGSRVLTKGEQDQTINRKTQYYNEEDGSAIEYMLWKVSIELHIGENFKFWALPDDFGCVGNNGTSTILLHAYIGRTITYGHLHNDSHNVNGRSVVVPSIRPSLFDCLNTTLRTANPAEFLNHTQYYSEQENHIRTLKSKVWYLTVDDLQLTSVRNGCFLASVQYFTYGYIPTTSMLAGHTGSLYRPKYPGKSHSQLSCLCCV